uniref:Nuclear factor, erythroid 2 n=1 Tax=Sphenodon punctatus TaxID=8508 RepID=A0A8D0GZG1_SPHPU
SPRDGSTLSSQPSTDDTHPQPDCPPPRSHTPLPPPTHLNSCRSGAGAWWLHECLLQAAACCRSTGPAPSISLPRRISGQPSWSRHWAGPRLGRCRRAPHSKAELEILSITELQGLDTVGEICYNPSLYNHPNPAAPPGSYGPCPVPGENLLPSYSQLGPALPCKAPEDPESDSGLSLNYSDAESLEPEGLERPEYTPLYPVDYGQPYSLLLPPVLEVPFSAPPSQPAPEKGHLARAELAGSRDERRALAMKIPFPIENIINLPVDDFNELVSRFPLSEPQLALVRDIRRRGKNKVAAQNCRKRKLETLVQLECELAELGRQRQRLLRDRGEVDRTLALTRQKLGALYRQVFRMLRDEAGKAYS